MKAYPNQRKVENGSEELKFFLSWNLIKKLEFNYINSYTNLSETNCRVILINIDFN